MIRHVILFLSLFDGWIIVDWGNKQEERKRSWSCFVRNQNKLQLNKFFVRVRARKRVGAENGYKKTHDKDKAHSRYNRKTVKFDEHLFLFHLYKRHASDIKDNEQKKRIEKKHTVKNDLAT